MQGPEPVTIEEEKDSGAFSDKDDTAYDMRKRHREIAAQGKAAAIGQEKDRFKKMADRRHQREIEEFMKQPRVYNDTPEWERIVWMDKPKMTPTLIKKAIDAEYQNFDRAVSAELNASKLYNTELKVVLQKESPEIAKKYENSTYHDDIHSLIRAKWAPIKSKVKALYSNKSSQAYADVKKAAEHYQDGVKAVRNFTRHHIHKWFFTPDVQELFSNAVIYEPDAPGHKAQAAEDFNPDELGPEDRAIYDEDPDFDLDEALDKENIREEEDL